MNTTISTRVHSHWRIRTRALRVRRPPCYRHYGAYFLACIASLCCACTHPQADSVTNDASGEANTDCNKTFNAEAAAIRIVAAQVQELTNITARQDIPAFLSDANPLTGTRRVQYAWLVSEPGLKIFEWYRTADKTDSEWEHLNQTDQAAHFTDRFQGNFGNLIRKDNAPDFLPSKVRSQGNQWLLRGVIASTLRELYEQVLTTHHILAATHFAYRIYFTVDDANFYRVYSATLSQFLTQAVEFRALNYYQANAANGLEQLPRLDFSQLSTSTAMSLRYDNYPDDGFTRRFVMIESTFIEDTFKRVLEVIETSQHENEFEETFGFLARLALYLDNPDSPTKFGPLDFGAPYAPSAIGPLSSLGAINNDTLKAAGESELFQRFLNAANSTALSTAIRPTNDRDNNQLLRVWSLPFVPWETRPIFNGDARHTLALARTAYRDKIVEIWKSINWSPFANTRPVPESAIAEISTALHTWLMNTEIWKFF